MEKAPPQPTQPPSPLPQMNIFPNTVWGGEEHFLFSLQNEFANPKQNTGFLL